MTRVESVVAAPLALRARGRLSTLDPTDLIALSDRALSVDDETRRTVADIVDQVRRGGDDALLALATRLDGVTLDRVEVPRARCEEALQALPPSLRRALDRAADNIARFHRAQLPVETRFEVEPGVMLTSRSVPLQRVGVYAPGGTAAYPSSVLMGVVPAKVAGVESICVCTPPAPDGSPPAEVLAAAALAGADRVFAIGGAGAVAAMAYGTKTVPMVDAIVGPGNRWVTEAKRQLAGTVVIDSPAGPSEVVVLADGSADPRLIAVELLAQAEHDVDAACVLISTAVDVVESVDAELGRLLARTPREAIAREALRRGGALLVADSLSEAIDFVERFAPEHLSVVTEDAAAQARSIRNAGTTFVGPYASVAFGDYLTGANHVLPTSGRARSFSGLSTRSFLRSHTIQEIDSGGARGLAEDVAILAEVEGLPAHAAAARARVTP